MPCQEFPFFLTTIKKAIFCEGLQYYFPWSIMIQHYIGSWEPLRCKLTLCRFADWNRFVQFSSKICSHRLCSSFPFFLSLRDLYTLSEVLVGWTNSFGNPPTLLTAERFCNFPKPTNDIPGHFSPWLASCVEMREEPFLELLSLALFFRSLLKYFCHYLPQRLAENVRHF